MSTERGERTLLVTNDFPPRPGGIQSYLAEITHRLPPDSLVVYAPAWRGAAAYDAGLPYPVVRHGGTLLLPEPRLLRRVSAVAASEGCGQVWFGTVAPLGLLSHGLARAGLGRAVSCSFGHELGWARLPVARALLRRAARGLVALTCVSQYAGEHLAGVLPGGPPLHLLRPGVDTTLFRPDADGAAVRRRLRLGEAPVVVCVSRLVARKGQDLLVRVLPTVRRAVPGTHLLLVGGGPDRDRLHRLARDMGVADYVRLTGSVPAQELPAYHAAGDVFALPVRSRRHGLEVEGLGMVLLEAAATGRAVVSGVSGGTTEAVRHGDTGLVVDARRAKDVADALIRLLGDRDLAAHMGQRGRAWMQQAWRWEDVADRMRALLLPSRSVGHEA